MFAHHDDLGYNGIARPPDPKDFSQLLEVFGSCFTYREDSVTEPAHAKRAQLIVEEVLSKLAGEQWNILNNG